MGFAYKPIPFDDLTAINKVAAISGVVVSFEEIGSALAKSLPKGLVLLDGMPTANFNKLIEAIEAAAPGINVVDVAQLYRPANEIQELIAPYLPTDREIDPELIFGKLFDQEYEVIFDKTKVKALISSISEAQTTILYGLGSACSLFQSSSKSTLFIDVIPKDKAQRVFDDKYQCLAYSSEYSLDALLRQTYFIDVELAVNLRKQLIQNKKINHYLLDSALSFSMVSAADLYKICSELATKPLRAKPIYVEGVWGGQFLRRYRRVPEHLVNKVAWSFELIHTEASLLVETAGHMLDIPFLTFMAAVAKDVVGEKLFRKYGGYLPIRFNYDDTWHSNGNMSIQCHPNDEMAQQLYGDYAAQNEAYYVVMTGHGAKTFCGFKGNPQEFLELSRRSEQDASMVAYEDYIHAIPSEVGRQIFLPAGTVHGSGRNQIVLELGTLTMSAYTYKIYDYTRMDITGKPRPLHTKLAEKALRFERTADWVMEHIAFPPKLLTTGDTWRELMVGYYEDMYFQTNRIEMQTGGRYVGSNAGGFCVLTIVDGESVRVQSLEDPNLFYDAKYLDVILVPATMQSYEVIAQGKQPVVLHKAFVREDKFE